MNFFRRILNFFGFGTQSGGIHFEQMLERLSSQAKQDEARRKAFQAIQKGDDIFADRIHPYEATLRTDSVKVDTACTQYHVGILKKIFGDAQYLSNLLKSGLHSELAQASPQEVEGKIKSVITQHHAEAKVILERYEHAKHDLEIFKGANGLGAAASYPDKANAMWWLAFFGIIEALFNAFFLRKGINFTQSLFVAFGAAGINIICNAFLGGGYRYKNHIDPRKARWGTISFIIAFLLILLINGGIAWYRLRYATMSEELNDAFILESTILFIVGICMGIAAFYKGYGLDDPYPGYGHYARECDKWASKLKALRTQHATYCTHLKQEADALLDHLGTKIISTFDDFSLKLPDLARQVKVWEEDGKQINFIYRQLQEIFKITITANHPKGNKGYPQALQNLPENTQLKSYAAQTEDFLAQKSGITEQVNKLRNSVTKQKEALQVWWQKPSTEDLLDFPKKTQKIVEEKVQKKQRTTTKKSIGIDK